MPLEKHDFKIGLTFLCVTTVKVQESSVLFCQCKVLQIIQLQKSGLFIRSFGRKHVTCQHKNKQKDHKE